MQYCDTGKPSILQFTEHQRRELGPRNLFLSHTLHLILFYSARLAHNVRDPFEYESSVARVAGTCVPGI